MDDVQDNLKEGIQFGAPYSLEREKGVGAWPRSEFLLRAGYKVEVLRTADEARAMVPQWRKLLTESGTKPLFQSADWCMAILDAMAYLQRHEIDVRIVTVQSGDRLVCLLPMMVEKRFGLRQARILGEPISQYSEILVAPGFPGAVDRAIAGFIESVDVDMIRLRRVREDGPLDSAMRQWRAQVIHVEASPFMAVTTPPKKRKMMDMKKKVHRQLDQQAYQLARLTGTECALHAESALAMKADWLKENKLVSRAFADPLWRDALVRTMSGHSPQFTPVMSVVQAENKVIAYNAGYALDGVIYGFLLAYNKDFKNLAPGYAGIVAEYEWAETHHIDRIDMMAPSTPYKSSMATGEMVVRDYALPLNRKGALYTRFVDGFIRRKIKDNAEHMPQFLNKLAVRFS